MRLVRQPVVAGRFYPGDPVSCRAAVEQLLPKTPATPAIGAIVPHAGWFYSGATAALALAAVAAAEPETVIFFGAAHSVFEDDACIWPRGAWLTPLGQVPVDEDLAGAIVGTTHVSAGTRAHEHEHSIEVQLPILQVLRPGVRIVPIVVQPRLQAARIGREVGAVVKAAAAAARQVAVVGSTDLTHYGPAYGFEPAGLGAAGIRWAKEQNDRRVIRLIEQLAADEIVSETAANHNACGGGAIAATVAAAVELGCTRYVELRHTTSAEVAGEPDARNAVGYGAGIFVA